MRYRALTVSREFGSGGGSIANIISGWLGWKLLDNAIIDAIAGAASVDSKVVCHYDERALSWLSRINEDVIRNVAMATGEPLVNQKIFDSSTMMKLTRSIMEEAYASGNCVIVGRGAQCILQEKRDVFHVHVYAPVSDRVKRVKQRLESCSDVEQRIRAKDAERVRYMQMHFGVNWQEPHLYNLLISSKDGEDTAASVIFHAMTGRTRD